MSAVGAWIRLDLRARTRSLLVLGLLVALTSAVVLTAVAGARRGSTAVDRLLDQTLPATVAALPNEPDFDWAAVAALPGVESIGRFAVSSFRVDGLPANQGVNFPYADPTMRDIERPIVLEGRLADPGRDDEAVITAAFEDRYGSGVGDTVTIRLLTPDQIDNTYLSAEAPDPEGPAIETTIVGVVRSPWFSDTGDSTAGALIPSTGLFAQHEANLLGNTRIANVNALVRLTGGAAAVPQFREQLAELTGRRDIEFFDLARGAQHTKEVAGFEANALLAFAAAAFIAAVFLVGQSVARYVSASMVDLRVLQDVGMPPRQVRVAAAAAPTLATIGGALIGVAVAVAASSGFPTGTAAALEPDPGRHADLVVLLLGVVVIPLLVALGATAAAWSASRAVGSAQPRRSRVSGLMMRTGAPAPVTVGTSFALDRGRGTQAVPVYPALVGAVVGVVGVVAALTFASGVNDAASHPERFGQVSALQVFLGFNNEDFLPTEDVLKVLADDPDVVAVNDTRQGVLESGPVDMAAFVIDPVDAPPPIVLLKGALPARSGEVALSTATADDLGVDVGDRIDLDGSRASATFSVSGIAFVPEGSHNAYDAGTWIGADGYDALIDGFKFHTADVALRPGAEAAEVAERLGLAVTTSIGAPSEAAAEIVEVRPPPSRLGELRQIRRLPLLLAGFLALLAVAAVGHALATAVRRRRHDLAVLRAIGLTKRQSRATVLVQGTLLGLFGLVFGVPLGFALGRWLWRSVADTTPVDYIAPVAIYALLLIAPVALLIVNLLAAWPSQRAASIRVAQVLRTE